jgi:hypothetical protein
VRWIGDGDQTTEQYTDVVIRAVRPPNCSRTGSSEAYADLLGGLPDAPDDHVQELIAVR